MTTATRQAAGNGRPIGQVLLEHGLITCDQLTQLLEAQPARKQRLGEMAVSMGFLQDEELARFLGACFELPYLALDEEELDLPVVELIPEAMARRYDVIAVKKDIEEGALTVAMVDPLDVRAVDAVRLHTGCRVRKVVAGRSSIQRALDRCYQASSRLAKSMDQLLAGEAVADVVQDDETPAGSRLSPEAEQLKHQASDAPVVQFVNLLLMRAIQERASDIHIEPEEHTVNVRLRVDGLLRDVSAPPKHLFQAITTRIKLLGNLDITERRLPQDGRFKFRVFDKTIDVRLSCLPTIFGEKLVLRILDRGTLILNMEQLGFEPHMLSVFNKVLHLPYGLVILTGPTGSGKTTTLYAALNAIRTPTKNIVTIEDPVEYQIPKINQVHTKAAIGLTFAAGLRSILRQDPDIIMVGEIRDKETADICIRSALTGHLVLSTLHTNDSVSAISRLTDMGVEPYLLTASLGLVMAQRLVRRICDECTEPFEPPADVLDRIQASLKPSGALASPKRAGESSAREGGWKLRKGRGCRRCNNTGYYGRIAVYEQFVITEPIKEMIAEGATLPKVREQAAKDGLQTLLHSALNKVRDGMTTLDEALSVCATQAGVLSD